MGLRPQERERGLVALNEARQQRRRAISFGRVRVREAATGFWLATFAGLAIFSFAYYRYTLVELEAKRSEVLARQRAVATALGTSGFELRDRIEQWVMALADGKLPEGVSAKVDLDDLARGPSIYLRLPEAEAHSAEGIRKAARSSLRDGFTSCLFLGSAPDLEGGKSCTAMAQCGPGEVCSDWNVCEAPRHPYNMRLLYDGLRVLTPEWLQSLEATTNEMQVRALDLDLQSVGKHEAVAAAEMVRRSRYFVAVLDEAAPDGSASSEPPLEGESSSDRLQAVDHWVRVGVWDLERASLLEVLRLEAAARFLSVGSGREGDARSRRAQQRQANNCAVATQLREALAPPAPGEPEVAAPPRGVE